ncbi:MAG: DUF721 domain-containing protein [Paracoccus sp. (in: a-proteobacteria)]
MSQPLRRSRGFRQAASLVAGPVRHAVEGRGFAVARLLTHWPEIVGTEIATRARPVRVGHGRGGFGATLTLLTTGPYAPLLEMQLPSIRDKVNACYGYNAITRIHLTQTAPTGFAEGQVQFDPGSPSPVEPSARTREAAESLASGVSDPALKAALTRLAVLKLTREGRNN